MDEPKQSTARASGFVVPVALTILAVAYVWPENDLGGATYSRLLGFQVEGQPLDKRTAGASIVVHLPLLFVAIAVARRVTARGRAFVLGAAALLGVAEVLHAAAFGVFGNYVGLPMWLWGAGGLLLLVSALGTMERERTAEIRESEGARA